MLLPCNTELNRTFLWEPSNSMDLTSSYFELNIRDLTVTKRFVNSFGI